MVRSSALKWRLPAVWAACVLACGFACITCFGADPVRPDEPASVVPPVPPTVSAADAPLVFDVPKLDHINIDGKGEDWGDRGFQVNVMASTAERVRPRTDLDGSFRLGWDERGLLVLARVTDNIDVENADPAAGGDGVELFVSAGPGSPDVVRTAIGPGLDHDFRKLRCHVCDLRTSPALVKAVPAPTAVASRRRVDGGYVLEVLLPWENLGIVPKPGAEIGFQLQIDDTDGDNEVSRLVWFPGLCSLRDKTQMHRIRLADAPSPAVRASAYGNYVRLHRAKIGVLAEADLVGKPIEVRKGDKVLAAGKLHADFVQEGRASGVLSLPMPPRDKPYGKLGVYLDGRHISTVDLPAVGDLAKWVLPYEELVFQPCVFSTKSFPEPDFENPSYVEDLIGSYEIRTTYYDANYNKVTTADKPGRYGAVVEIQGEDGAVFKRYGTLFREPKNLIWRNADMAMTLTLPREMGINPAVLKDQSHSVSEYFKRLMGDEGLNREPDTAVLLAGLFEAKPGKPLVRTGPLARDQEWWAGLKRKLGDLKTNYLTYLPPGYEKDKAKKWPLIVFLHGKGERGECLEEVRWNGLPMHREFHPDMPFVIVAPQCPFGGWWSPWEIDAMLDEVMAKYQVDPDRVYLTGMSMGGYGTWATAIEFPDRFAAIAPLCGGGDPADAARLKHIPVWAFHGEKDSVVPFKESQAMVDALKAAGADVKFTTYPECDHDCWTPTYANEELYSWFLQHTRHAPDPALTGDKMVASAKTESRLTPGIGAPAGPKAARKTN